MDRTKRHWLSISSLCDIHGSIGKYRSTPSARLLSEELRMAGACGLRLEVRAAHRDMSAGFPGCRRLPHFPHSQQLGSDGPQQFEFPAAGSSSIDDRDCVYFGWAGENEDKIGFLDEARGRSSVAATPPSLLLLSSNFGRTRRSRRRAPCC
jgi:hypothetical protein